MTEVQTFFKEPAKRRRRRAHNSTLPAGSTSQAARRRSRNQTGVSVSMRSTVHSRARGMCQAEGLHHPDCPGVLPAGDWVPHHVWPRGTRNNVGEYGPDTVDNLIAVWCPSGLGWNGCHGQIHRNATQATELGLLSRGHVDLSGT